MSNIQYDYVIVRKNILAETYGAWLLNDKLNTEIIQTDQITTLPQDILDKIKGKKVFIVGGYYSKQLEEIYNNTTQSITVFYNNGDDISYSNKLNHEFYMASQSSGFCYFIMKYLDITDSWKVKLADALDEVMCGFPSEESLQIQYGFYSYYPEAKDNYEKFNSIDDVMLIGIIENGKNKRNDNLMTAKTRVRDSKLLTVLYEEKEYIIRVAIGDSPIMDSCIALAEASPSGIGLLVRFDLAKTKTLYSIRKVDLDINKNLNMGNFISTVFKCGGGSYVMAGGSIDGLHFP